VDWEKIDGQLLDQAQVGDAELIIPSVSISDQGTYRCTATSAAGQTSRQISVIVQGLTSTALSLFRFLPTQLCTFDFD